MYNLYVIFAKFLCKQVTGNLVNESQNILRRDAVPKLSNFEIVALIVSFRCLYGYKSIRVAS